MTTQLNTVTVDLNAQPPTLKTETLVLEDVTALKQRIAALEAERDEARKWTRLLAEEYGNIPSDLEDVLCQWDIQERNREGRGVRQEDSDV